MNFNLSDKQIKAIEELTGLIHRRTNAKEILFKDKNEFRYLVFRKSSMSIDYHNFLIDYERMAFPIAWIKPLAEILEEENKIMKQLEIKENIVISDGAICEEKSFIKQLAFILGGINGVKAIRAGKTLKVNFEIQDGE